jgi:thiamine biosynthesis protein ThiS
VSGAEESKAAGTSAQEIEIIVNGEPKQVPRGLDIPRLLDHLGIRADRVAIERNLNILPKDRWKETIVGSGDRYEIVHFVGGG